jgi:ribosome-associated protein
VKRESRRAPLSVSGADAGSWICVDFVDIVLHLFEAEQRALYDLELLWGDAKRVEMPETAPAG